LVVVIVFNFLLFRTLPGDPIKLLFRNSRLTQDAQANLREQFGLDKPVWIDADRLGEGDIGGAFDTQFTSYVKNLFRGELGVSFATRQDVSELLIERVWRTALLVFTGELAAILLGSLVGLIAAWRRGSWVDG